MSYHHTPFINFTVTLQDLASAFAPVAITDLWCVFLFLVGSEPGVCLLLCSFWVFTVHVGLLNTWLLATFVCLYFIIISIIFSAIHDSWSSICILSLNPFEAVSLHLQWSCVSLNLIRISMIIINHCSWWVGGSRWPMERWDNRHAELCLPWSLWVQSCLLPWAMHMSHNTWKGIQLMSISVVFLVQRGS